MFYMMLNLIYSKKHIPCKRVLWKRHVNLLLKERVKYFLVEVHMRSVIGKETLTHIYYVYQLSTSLTSCKNKKCYEHFF